MRGRRGLGRGPATEDPTASPSQYVSLGDELGGGGRRPGGLAKAPIDVVDEVAPDGGGEK